MLLLQAYLKSCTLVCILTLCLTLPAISRAQTNNQFVILQYHHVSTTTPASTSLSFESFRSHMSYLQDNAFAILALEDALDSMQQGIPLPDKAAVITFDDNYLSVYTEAFPLLKQLDWPFTVFVSTGLVGSNDRLYASWQQVNEMANAGATIANHTVSHLHLLEVLKGESEDRWLQRIELEINDAELKIKQQTGQNHKILAYPYGEYNPAIQNLLKRLGFTGIAQHSGAINTDSDFSALPRFPLSGIYASMNSFPTKVNSLAFSLEQVRPNGPITADPSPSATLLFTRDDYRLNQLSCYNNGERISVQKEESELLYSVSSHLSNQTRRFRYNCTAPSDNGRYYWYSINWINPTITPH